MLKEFFHSIIALRCLITLCKRCYVKQLQCTKHTHIDNIRATRHHFAEISGKRKAKSRAEGKERAFLILLDGAQALCHTAGQGSHPRNKNPFLLTLFVIVSYLHYVVLLILLRLCAHTAMTVILLGPSAMFSFSLLYFVIPLLILCIL